MLQVKFVVHCKKPNNNSTIRIVGNLPEIGAWNPLNGLELEEYYEGEWESLKSIQIANGNPHIIQGMSSNLRLSEYLPTMRSSGRSSPIIQTANSDPSSMRS